uniref:DUF674 family protein n=2 Tax=Aegilops tauschii subsp. strangulata TaxID=200361 RepID=A0A453E270_AEGTS
AKRKGGSAGSRKKKGKKGATANVTAMTMKLLVDTTAQRVVYAEAGKDVVDFLFSLLTLPLGTVAGLLNPGSMVGSVGNLQASVNKLDDSYMCRDDAKAALCTLAGRKLLQLAPAKSGDSGVASRAAQAGFVQGVVTYTVRDDLKVAPVSAISGITLLKSLGIKDIGSLQEKTVQLGHAEGLGILRASLRSKTVLTDVFLGKKKRKAEEASRHEAVSRVVRRRRAWACSWRPWYVSAGPCSACGSRRASCTARQLAAGQRKQGCV